MSGNRVLNNYKETMNNFGSLMDKRWATWLETKSSDGELDFTLLDLYPAEGIPIVNWDIMAVQEKEKITKMFRQVKLSVDVVRGLIYVQQFAVPVQEDDVDDIQEDDADDTQEDDVDDVQEDDVDDTQDVDLEADYDLSIEQGIALNNKAVSICTADIVGYGMRSKISADKTGQSTQSVWVPHNVDRTLTFALNRDVWQSDEWGAYCKWAGSERRNPFVEAQHTLNRNGIYMIADGNRWNHNTNEYECALRFTPYVEKQHVPAQTQQAPAVYHTVPAPASARSVPVETQRPVATPVQTRQPAPVQRTEPRVAHVESRRPDYVPTQQPVWGPQVYHTGVPMQQYVSPYQMGYNMPMSQYYPGGYHASTYAPPYHQNVMWSYAPAQ